MLEDNNVRPLSAATNHRPPACHPSSPLTLPPRIYELYTDFVLKNPFYETEQVIRCELFDEAIENVIRKYPMTA